MTKGFKEVNSSVNTLINNIDKTSTKVASLESKLENLKKGTVKTDAYKELEDSVKRQSAEYDKQVEKYNELIAKQDEMIENRKKMEANENVVIDTKLDTSEMTKGIKEVNSSVNTLINNIDKTSTKVASLESKLENLKKGTVKTDAYKQLEDSVKKQSAQYDKQIEKYNELIAKQTELQNSNHAYGKEWEDVTDKIAEADNKLARMGEQLDNDKYSLQYMQTSGKAFQIDDEAIKNTSEKLREAQNQLNIYLQKLEEKKEYDREWEDVTAEIAEAESKLAQMSESLDSNKSKMQDMQDSGKAFQVDNEAVKDTSESLREARNQLELYSQKLDELEGKEKKKVNIGTQLKNTFSGVRKSLSSTVNPMKKFNDRFKGLAKRVFIFGIIASGLRKVKDSLQSLLGSDKEVKGYMNQIKANLTLAFAPLYDAILPALKVVLQYVVKLTSYLAAFVSKLFGGADASKKLASNMASTATSANKVQKALASIDEINAIDIETGDTGVTDAINNWQMNSNGFIDNMAAAIKDGDWRAIASSMSDLISTALSNINSFLKKVNWKKLGKNIGAFISGIKWGEIAINMLELARTIISALIDAFSGFAEEAPLAALALAIAGPLKLLKFDSKSSAMKSVGGRFANTLMAAIGAAVGGFQAGKGFWKKYIGEDGDEWITDMGLMDTIDYLFEDMDSLKEGFSMLWDDMAEGFGTSWTAFTDWLSGTWVGEAAWSVSNALETFWGKVKKGWNSIVQSEVVDLTDGFASGLEDLANDNEWWGKIQASPFWDTIKRVIEDAAGVSLEGIDLSDPATRGIIKSILEARVSGDWSLVAKAVADYNDKLANQFGTNFNNNSHKSFIGSYIAKVLSDAVGMVRVESKYKSSTLGNLVNLGLSPVSRVPMLANGAVIPPNRQFLAMLGDQKHGTNIEAPLDTIVEAVEKANAGRSGQTVVNVQISGQTLFKIFLDEYKKETSITDVDPIIGI